MGLRAIPAQYSLRYDISEYITRGICIRCGERVKYFTSHCFEYYYNQTGLCEECQEINSIKEAPHGGK